MAGPILSYPPLLAVPPGPPSHSRALTHPPSTHWPQGGSCRSEPRQTADDLLRCCQNPGMTSASWSLVSGKVTSLLSLLYKWGASWCAAGLTASNILNFKQKLLRGSAVVFGKISLSILFQTQRSPCFQLVYVRPCLFSRAVLMWSFCNCF